MGKHLIKILLWSIHREGGRGREGKEEKGEKVRRRRRREGRRKKGRKEGRREGREGGRKGGMKEGVFEILFAVFPGPVMMYPIIPSLWDTFANFDTFPGQTLPPASL